MGRNRNPINEDGSVGKKRRILPPCRVCGGPAAGFHYGANTCEACKAFFHRSIRRHHTYKCDKPGSCPIEHKEASMCQRCRYSKCLGLGMSKDAIKTGRYTKTKKSLDEKEVISLREQQGDVGDTQATLTTSNNGDQAGGKRERHCSSEEHPYTHDNQFTDSSQTGNSVGFGRTKNTSADDTQNTSTTSPVKSKTGSRKKKRCRSEKDKGHFSNDTPVYNQESDGLQDRLLDQLSPPEAHNSTIQEKATFKSSQYSDMDLSSPASVTSSGAVDLFQTAVLTPKSVPEFHPDASFTDGAVSENTQKTTLHPSPTSKCQLFSQKHPEMPSLQHEASSSSYHSPPQSSSFSEGSVPSALSPELSPMFLSPNSHGNGDGNLSRPITSVESLASCSSPCDRLSCQVSSGEDGETSDVPHGLCAQCHSSFSSVTIAQLFQDRDRTIADLTKARADFVDPLFNTPSEEKQEQMFLEHKDVCRLRQEMFGPMQRLPDHEFDQIYESTGIDTDGRMQRCEKIMNYVEKHIRSMVKFAKRIPGFKVLGITDKVNLIKQSREEFIFVTLYRNVDSRRKVAFCCDNTIRCDICIRLEHRGAVADLLTNKHIELAGAFRELCLTHEEDVMIQAIILMTPDREIASSDNTVRQIHSQLLDCLWYLLQKRSAHPAQLYSKVLSVISDTRRYSRQLSLSIKDLSLQKYTSLMENPLLQEVLCGVAYNYHEMLDSLPPTK